MFRICQLRWGGPLSVPALGRRCLHSSVRPLIFNDFIKNIREFQTSQNPACFTEHGGGGGGRRSNPPPIWGSRPTGFFTKPIYINNGRQLRNYPPRRRRRPRRRRAAAEATTPPAPQKGWRARGSAPSPRCVDFHSKTPSAPRQEPPRPSTRCTGRFRSKGDPCHNGELKESGRWKGSAAEGGTTDYSN
jgi:hypothetical protein